MKAILAIGIIFICAVLFAGCTTPQPPGEPLSPAPNIPDLVGNWSGTSTGHVGDKGFTDYGGDRITMQVSEQKGRIFKGEFLITSQNGTIFKTIEFSGAFNHDPMLFTIVERNGGYSFGTITGPGEIELIHADDKESSDIAIDSLKKF